MSLDLSLRSKLYGATAGALVVILLMAGVTLFSNQAATKALQNVVDNNVRPLLLLQEIDRNLKEMRFRAAGVLLDQMPAPGSRQHLIEASKAISVAWGEYKTRAGAGTGEESDIAGKLGAGIAALPALVDKLDKAYSSSDDKKALEGILEEDWPGLTTNVIKPMEKLIAIRDKEVKATYEESRALGRRLNIAAMAIFGATVVVMLIAAVAMVRGITRSVSAFQQTLAEVARGDLTVRSQVSGSDEIAQMSVALNTTVAKLNEAMVGVNDAAGELANASGQLSGEAAQVRQRAEKQTEGVMQISAAMQEGTVSVGEISTGAAKVSEAAGRAQALADQGTAIMRESRGATERALQAAAASTQAVGELSSSIERINQIATVIREIADQTNLLALNANIEAARAGEAGRGFAVVADEVRKLAERTAKSTADIAGMIGAIQTQAATAVTAMSAVDQDVKEDAAKVGHLDTALREIIAAAREVSMLAGEIAHATREQQKVAEQTAAGMESISSAVSETTTTINNVASTAAGAAQTAVMLKTLVSRFRLV